jgi:hypothetical protein
MRKCPVSTIGSNKGGDIIAFGLPTLSSTSTTATGEQNQTK